MKCRMRTRTKIRKRRKTQNTTYRMYASAFSPFIFLFFFFLFFFYCILRTNAYPHFIGKFTKLLRVLFFPVMISIYWKSPTYPLIHIQHIFKPFKKVSRIYEQLRIIVHYHKFTKVFQTFFSFQKRTSPRIISAVHIYTSDENEGDKIKLRFHFCLQFVKLGNLFFFRFLSLKKKIVILLLCTF